MKQKSEVIIYLNDLEEAVNKYNPNILSDELTNYILKRCMFIPFKTDVDIVVYGIEDKDQEKFKNIFHNHFKYLVDKTKKIEQYDDVKRIILLMLGIVLICVSEMFKFVVSELFLVAGWVVIWELVYNIFFERIKRNRDYLKYLQLSKADIKFK